ncbi:hypothetical protein [Peribacillus loiseleuriae]|uniref:hypothetical protein n=1 Tax=Peribacillus loiseleuriae TaxID=1679170 RepID=UPI000A544517|nr:hypothetical protein [Peribacillus loiseleuriae]
MDSLEKQKEEANLFETEHPKSVDSMKDYVRDGSSEYIEQLFMYFCKTNRHIK